MDKRLYVNRLITLLIQYGEQMEENDLTAWVDTLKEIEKHPTPYNEKPLEVVQ